MTTLAVYRTLIRTYGADEDADGRHEFYFVAPAGLHAADAVGERIGDFYANQCMALGRMIELQHEENRGDDVEAYDRMAFAAELHAEHDLNDWDASESPEQLAQAAYAVVISRDSDGWIVGARDRDQVAAIYLATLTGTEGYDEWISGVFRMSDGTPVSFAATVNVTVDVDDGTGRAGGTA